MINEVSKKDIKTDIYNSKNKLNPLFWIDNKLNSRVRLKLMDLSNDFIDELNIKWVKPSDVVITGSLANYNWTKYSDIDIHIIMDYKKIHENTKFVKSYFDSKKEQWSNEHDELNIFGYPVEMYVEDLNNPSQSNGVYSINKNSWIKEPKKQKDDDFDEEFIKETASKMINKIDSIGKKLEKEKDRVKYQKLSDKLVNIFDELKAYRKKGLSSKKKEMSEGNILWKVMKNMGYISKIWDIANNAYDKTNSIKKLK